MWLFAVVGIFYTVQKPFSPEAAVAIINALLDLLTVGWLGVLALGLGYRGLRWLKLVGRTMTDGEALIIGVGLGLGGLGLLTFSLGLAGLLYSWLFITLSLLLSLLLWPDLLALKRRLRFTDRPYQLTGFYIMAVSLLTLIIALLPPIDWDGLFYHLTAPKLFIQNHGIRPGLDVPHFNFPFLMEMLFTYAMLLKGDIAAKLVHTLYGGLLAGLVYLTARRFLSQAAAWPAVLVLLSMPMVSTLAGWAYNDLALAFYQGAALYALLRSHRSKEDNQLQPSFDAHWLILSGLLAGLAMGLKYTSFVAPLTIGLLLLWRMLPKNPSILHPPPSTFQWKAIFFFALPALLVALPWYLKNLFFTGNPFYPFAAGLFNGLYWDQFRANWYAQAGSGIGFDPLTLLGLPILATLGIKDANYFDGRTGPLFLAFLPLMIVYGLGRYRASARPPALNVLLFFALAQFIFWMLGVIWSRSLWQSRLLLPGLVALCPVVGWLWQDLSHLDWPGFSVRRFANLLITLVLCLNLFEFSLNFIQINPLPYLTGYESRADYLTRRLGAYYATMEKLNQTLPPTAAVLFLWEPRTYFCRLTCRPDSILDQLAHDQFVYGDAANIVAAWKQMGISHVLLHRQGLDFIKAEGTEAVYQPALQELAVLEAQYFEPVFDIAGAYQVYALK
jgi:4-amino-4-deoxy-L-arabinose transferase-like glycosyltransferase